MGTWGAGAFDSDTATEFRDRAVYELISFIRSDLPSLDDDLLERETIAAIACLRALLSGTVDRDYASTLLEPEEADRWRDQYLAWLERNERWFGPEHFAEVRENVESEFRQLRECLGEG